MAKTLEQKLCKRSAGYTFVRDYLVRPFLYFYYRKIDVTGAKTVPDAGPVIFTPNHQNALMDALAVLCTKDRQPVFVARADIFKKPLIIKIFHFLRILPIFRKRDGGNSADNNQETFDLILKVLNSQQAVGIMPEGTHNEIKRLRVLQKGVFRLAMQAQEKHGNIPMVKIVPVGIEYTCAYKFRSDLMVRYGEAIEASDFYDLYIENSARALKKMQNVLTAKMQEGMIHIDNEQYYSEIERLRVLYQKQASKKLGIDMRNAENRLQTQKKIIDALQKHALEDPDKMSSLALKVKEYEYIINKFNFRDWVIERQPYSLANLLGRCLLAILGIPFWMLGLLFNYLPYKLSEFASSKVKDPQFVSSVQYVAGLVLFPLYYLIMITLMVFVIPTVWGKIIMPLFIIPSGLVAFRYYLSMKKLGARFRFWTGKRKKNQKILDAIELRKNIFDEMNELFDKTIKCNVPCL